MRKATLVLLEQPFMCKETLVLLIFFWVAILETRCLYKEKFLS